MNSYAHDLAEYSRWANGRILECAARVDVGDYRADFPGLSFGSLHGTLVHLVGATATWLGRWQATDAGLGVPPADFEDVRRYAEVTDAALVRFVDACSDADLRREVQYLGPDGVTYTDPLLMQLTHLLLHGMQFRAEAAVRLSALGLSPGNLDLTVLLRQG